MELSSLNFLRSFETNTSTFLLMTTTPLSSHISLFPAESHPQALYLAVDPAHY